MKQTYQHIDSNAKSPLTPLCKRGGRGDGHLGCLIIALCLWCVYAQAEEVTLTLPEAIAVALRDNRDVLLQSEELQKSKHSLVESQAALWPALSLVAGETRTQGYYAGKELWQFTGQITLKQYLYKGGATVASIAQDTYQIEADQALLEQTKIETALVVKKAFFTLLLAEEFARLNQKIFENAEKRIAWGEARFAKGQASELEILQLKERLENARAVYNDSLNQIESARNLLKNLFFISDDVRIKLEGQFVYQPKEMAVEQALLTALAQRPEIRQYEAQRKVKEQAVEITKAENRPAVYASWDYYSRSHLAGTTVANWNDHHIMGVTFSCPVFDGWATRAKIAQAVADLHKARINEEQIVKDITLELNDAYLALKDAVGEVEKTEASCAVHTRNLETVRAQAAKGIASRLDVEDVALNHNAALFSRCQAVYNYTIAQSSLDKAMGGY